MNEEKGKRKSENERGFFKTCQTEGVDEKGEAGRESDGSDIYSLS